MSDRLRRALERLEAAFVARGNPVVAGLQPGLSEAKVRARLLPLGIDAPPDLVTLFSWHNGYKPPEGPTDGGWHGWIGPGIRPITLDEACDMYSNNLEDFELDPDVLGGAKGSDCFPILDGDGWTSYLMDCRGDGPERGSVMAYHITNTTEPAQRPRTLAEPIDSAVGYVESGAWRWSRESGWVDHRTEAEIARGIFF